MKIVNTFPVCGNVSITISSVGEMNIKYAQDVNTCFYFGLTYSLTAFFMSIQSPSISIHLFYNLTMSVYSDAAPALTYTFIEQTLQPGPAVSLKCSAQGNPTPQIIWALDGFSLPNNIR